MSLVRTGHHREIYERNTPVESPSERFSDRGSTPLASTIHYHVTWEIIRIRIINKTRKNHEKNVVAYIHFE